MWCVDEQDLGFGISYASVQFRCIAAHIHNSFFQFKTKVIPEPIIGREESNREGPWPECVGITGENCVRLIETHAEDLRGRIYIIPEGSMVTQDYDTTRVRVWVNAEGIVNDVPSRG